METDMTKLQVIRGGLDEIRTPQGMPPRQWHSEDTAYEQIDIEIDPELGALWSYMRPRKVPCFNPQLLNELADLQRQIETSEGVIWHQGKPVRLRYYLQASRVPGVFNYGGDLALFAQLAEARDRNMLMRYSTTCVENLCRCLDSFGQPIATIGVVQGDALGGGFECALAMNVLVAERNAKMGFPEILFNMFPGMGAYSFLARRVSMRVAEDMMYSGAT
jgi:DSF synthase